MVFVEVELTIVFFSIMECLDLPIFQMTAFDCHVKKMNCQD